MVYDSPQYIEEAYRKCQLLPASPQKNQLEYLIYPSLALHSDRNEGNYYLNQFLILSQIINGRNSLYYANDLLTSSYSYHRWGDTESALNVLKKAKGVLEIIGEKDNILYIKTLYNLGRIFYESFATDSALQCYLECEECLSLEDVDILPDLFIGLMDVYLDKEDYLEANHYLTKGILDLS